MRVSAQVNRVAVEHGHTACMSREVRTHADARRCHRRASPLDGRGRRARIAERAGRARDGDDGARSSAAAPRRARRERHVGRRRARAQRSDARPSARRDGTQHDSRRGGRIDPERRADVARGLDRASDDDPRASDIAPHCARASSARRSANAGREFDRAGSRSGDASCSTRSSAARCERRSGCEDGSGTRSRG